jgi:hypothetical protein
MNAAPVVTRRANAVPRAGSQVQTLRLSPNGVALASRTASSSWAIAIAATGPKVSSSKAGTPGPGTASAVGSK